MSEGWSEERGERKSGQSWEVKIGLLYIYLIQNLRKSLKGR